MSELIKNQRFGVEVEFTGISRETAAKCIAQVISNHHISSADETAYHRINVTDLSDNRKWTIMRDSSIEPKRSGMPVPGCSYPELDEYRVEFVTPILTYKDIPTLQAIIRKFREAGGVVNRTCGIHVHVDGTAHNDFSLRRLCNFMVARQDLIYESLGVGNRKNRWCRPISEDLLKAMKSRKELRPGDLERIWYSEANDGYYGGIDHRHYNSTRYHGANLHSYFSKGTVEFRLFNSTLHAGKIKAYIQLCLAISAWAIESSEDIKFSRKINLTTAQKKTLFRNILRNRLELTCDEFKTCRHHLLANFKEAAAREPIAA